MMTVELIDEKRLNQYLVDIVYQGQEPPKFKASNFKSADYVEEYKDAIIKGMVSQYFKHRIRGYFKKNQNAPYFIPVEMSDDLPSWAKDKIANGGKVFDFHPDKIQDSLKDKITSVKDYLYKTAQMYIDKIIITARETGKEPKIKLEYLKTNNEIDTFEKAIVMADKWHKAMYENFKKVQKTKKTYEKSLKGSKEIMKFDDGTSVYQLLSPKALDYESEYMGHCIGQGSYDDEVKNGKIQIYSIRGADGEPHVTIEVRDGAVEQCKGKGNKPPVKKYIPYIQKFIKSKNFDIEGDINNTGLIKDKDGVLHNIYDLPEQGIEIDGALELSGEDFAENLINLSRIICKKLELFDVDFAETPIDLSLIKCKKLKLYEVNNPPEILDVSNCEKVDIYASNLSNVKEIKWPSENVYLSRVVMPEILDLSNCDEVTAMFSYFRKTKKIKWAKKMVLRFSKLPKILDLSGCEEVDASDCNFKNVTQVKWAKKINLCNSANLSKVLNFSHCEDVKACGSVFKNVDEIILPPKDTIKEGNFKWLKSVPKKINIRYAEPEKEIEKFNSGAENLTNKSKNEHQKTSLIDIIKHEGQSR